MIRKEREPRRRRDALSRDRIVEVSIGILDDSGIAGLTFQALAKRLATGAGAIYHHVDDKNDLLTAACDAIVVRALSNVSDGSSPSDTIRSVALAMFDAVDGHPWIGNALHASPGQMPAVRLLERIGSQVQRMGVAPGKQWSVVSALLAYIMGVAAQNAANAQFAQANDLHRETFLSAVADDWAGLDPERYPFTSSIAEAVKAHDDRDDFLAGVDFIIAGVTRYKP